MKMLLKSTPRVMTPIGGNVHERFDDGGEGGADYDRQAS
jgi:hypothetical protein